MGFFDFFNRLFVKRHVRLGVALGSGGAKGAALVGMLKAFEEAGVKFDIVAGTSIGSIVGGFLSLGYNSTDMLGLVKQYGMTDPKKLLIYKVKGASLDKMLAEMLGEKGFNETLLPFCAVATDINSGEEVDIRSGSLSVAMAASSAIPPMFKPVGRKNRKLVDGAFVNAVPADVVKKMGADVVISLNLTHVATNSVGKATLDAMYPGNGVKEGDRLHQMEEYSDYVLTPDLTAFNTSDVGAFEQMYSIGYRTAKEKMPEILALLKKKKVKID